MLTEVQAVSAQGSLLSLPLGEVSNGIFIKDIEGLDPVKATIVSSSAPGETGEIYLASKREARDIKLTLGLNPDYVAEQPRDVRARLYQFFMPRTFVDLTFVDTNASGANISGMVETFEAPLFAKDPEATIVVRCFKSDFVDQDLVSISGSSVSNTLDTTFNYTGSVETGLEFYLLIDRDVDEFSLYNTMPNGQFRQFDFAYQLHNGDQVNIISVPGEKKVQLVRAGATSSILYAMSPQSNWIDFYPGVNLFRVYAEGAPLDYLMYYNNRYGGL